MDETTKISVSALALHKVLLALGGPAHHIRELQATRSLHLGPNPINQLTEEFNHWLQEQKSNKLKGKQ